MSNCNCYYRFEHYMYRGYIFHISIFMKKHDKKFIEESYDTLFDLVELFGFDFNIGNCHSSGQNVRRDNITIYFYGQKFHVTEKSLWSYIDTRYELFEYLHKKYPTFYQPNLKLAIHET